MEKGRTALQRTFSEENVKDSYSKIAWFYDFWSRLTESKAARKAIELAQIRDGEQILEVAVGTGLVFAEIVKRNTNGRNEGIDISPSMLSRAERRLKHVKGSFRLQIGNAYQLPFEANTFDLIVSNFMFDLLPEADFATVLFEFNRVLKPSGRVVISTMALGERWYNRPWHWVAKHFPSLLTGCRPVSMHDYLVKAGFGNIEAEHLSQSTFPSEVLRAEKRATSP